MATDSLHKPEMEQLQMALEAAQRMHRHAIDPHHLAQALLYLKQRNDDLEVLLTRAERLLRFGQSTGDLAALTRLVARLREQEEKASPGSDSERNLTL